MNLGGLVGLHEDNVVTAQEFVYAIGKVESNNNPNAQLGDDGRAQGRFQCHPDWWDTWQPKSGIRAVVGDTWDSWQVRVLSWFFDYHATLDPVILAMYYHLGHISQPTDSDWDVDYASKFKAAAGIQ
jgi:hypothetical protein